MNLPRSYVKYPEPEGTVFYESWCTDLEKSAIEYAYSLVSDVSGESVEVGCFEGRSAVFTANLISPNTLIAVDPWLPIPEATYEIDAYGKRDIFEIFSNNIAVGTKGNVDVHKMGWEEFFSDKTPEDFGIRAIYVDGPHTYVNVLESLEKISPFVVPGGVMFGDDYDDPEVRRAVDEFFGGDMTHPLSGRTWLWRNEA